MASSGGFEKVLTIGALGVGAYFAYEWFFAPAATAAPAPPPVAAPPATTTSTAVVTTAPATTTATPPANSAQLDAIYLALKSAAAADPNFTGSGDSLTSSPYRWNFYLQRVVPGATMAAPVSNTPDLSATFPGVDLSQPMTASVYWAGMSRALGATQGVSGFLAGLGALVGARALKARAIRQHLGLGDVAMPIESFDVVSNDSGGTALISSDLPSTGPQSGPLINPGLPAIMGGTQGGTITGTDPNTGQPVTIATNQSTLGGVPVTYWIIGGVAAFFGLALLQGARR